MINIVILLLLLLLLNNVQCIEITRKLITKIITSNILATQLLLPVVADSTFQDQLRVVQAQQVNEQVNRVDEERKIEKNNKDNNDIIGLGLVALPASSNEEVDPIAYPLGFADATSLDSKYSSKEASLIITAVGKQSNFPLAGKKYELNKIKFPFYFEITTKDLMFPYTALSEADRRKLSTDSVAITAILDCDGKLSTSDACERFGFSISDPIKLDGVMSRTEAKITTSFRNDGKEYNNANDVELLERVDAELKRLGFSKI